MNARDLTLHIRLVGSTLGALHSLLAAVGARAALRWSTSAVTLLIGMAAADAQAPSGAPRDTLRGVVRAPDSAAVPGVTVRARSVRTLVMRTAESDRNGQFTLVFSDTSAVYELVAQKIGHRPSTLRVVRDSIGRVPHIALSLSPIVLPTVRATAQRATVQVRPGGSMGGETSSPADSYNWEDHPTIDIVGMHASLAELAGAMPGATLLPGQGFSINGASPESNSFSLNGMRVDAQSLPTLATLSARMSSTAYGAASGGFTGAEVAMKPFTAFDYTHAIVTLSYVDPSWQSAGPVSRSLGRTGFRSLAAGSRFFVPLRTGWIASVLADLNHRSNASADLFGADTPALGAYAISPDTVARLRQVLGGLGVPTTGAAAVAQSNGFKLLGEVNYDRRYSFVVPRWAVRNWKLWANVARDESDPTFSPAEAATTAGARTGASSLVASSAIIELPAKVTAQIAAQHQEVKQELIPASALPGGSVVLPAFVDDSSVAQTFVSFGGGAGRARTRTSSPQAKAEIRWNTRAAHQLMVVPTWQRTSYREERFATPGEFVFPSLDALASSTPSSFARTFDAAAARAHVDEVSVNVGDIFRVRSAVFSTSVQLTRVSARVPGIDDARVTALLGGPPRGWTARTDASPRVGVSWTPIDQSRAPLGSFRGGVGVYRNRASALTFAGTGTLTRRSLFCVAGDVPTPDWSAYSADPSSIPAACASGGGPIDTGATSVRLIGPGYQPSWSRKYELEWDRRLPALARLHLKASHTDAFALPSLIDRNRHALPVFSLVSEGARPIFVPSADIDASTGVADSRAARRLASLAQVLETSSDGRSHTTQLMAQLSRRLWTGAAPWRLTYTFSRSRELQRGAGGSDPLAPTWAPGPFAPAHQFQLAWPEIEMPAGLRLGLYGQLASGRPFTPRVAGDVNGDGQWNDAAYVFDPATATDPALTNGLQALLDRSSPRIRDCLLRQQGRIAQRNSCRGPWTSWLNMSLRIPIRDHAFRTSTVVLRFTNLLGLIDQALHGEANREGWGDSRSPDPTLLRVRSFDPMGQRFTYDVNPTFGTPRRGATTAAFRTPFVVSMEIMRDISRHPDERDLDGFIRRMTPGDTSRAAYQSLDWVSSRYSAVLNRRQALLLTTEQVQALQKLHDSTMVAHREAVRPLVLALSLVDGRKDRERVRQIRRQARGIDLRFRRDAAFRLRDLLSDDQWELVDHHVREDVERGPHH